MVEFDTNLQNYKKILAPHDGSGMSDRSLSHAVTIALLSKGQINILNVVEEDTVPPSILLTFLKEGSVEDAKENLRKTIEISSKKFLEEKVKMCKDKGVEYVSYMIKIGKPSDEIVNVAEQINADLLVMASSRIFSPINILGSTVRRVIDSTKRPVLIVHG